MLRMGVHSQGRRAKQIELTLPDISNCYKNIVHKIWYQLRDFLLKEQNEKTQI